MGGICSTTDDQRRNRLLFWLRSVFILILLAFLWVAPFYNEVCPVWPGQPVTAHWGLFDPAAAEESEKRIAFAKAFAILERRISLFTSLPVASLERMALERQVRDIGTVGEA